MFQYLPFLEMPMYPIELNNDVLIANWSFANIRTVAFAEKSKRRPGTFHLLSWTSIWKANSRKWKQIFSREKHKTFLHWQLQCVTKLKQKPFKLLTASFLFQHFNFIDFYIHYNNCCYKGKLSCCQIPMRFWFVFFHVRGNVSHVIVWIN